MATLTPFMADFREQLVTRKVRGRWANRLVAVMDASPKTALGRRKRERALARVERHAMVHLQDEGAVAVTRTGATKANVAIDWEKFFDGLLKFLLAILPMLLPLFL